jgi:hypothetical protein
MQPHKVSPVLLGGILLVLVAGVAIFLTNSKGSSESSQVSNATTSSQPTSTPTQEADLILQNVGLASIEASTVYTRFAVQDYATKGMKGFYIFGDTLPGNRVNPNFEFASLKADAKVISSIDGVVTFVREQPETKDYEVFIQPKEGSVWTIGYDHLVNLTVAKGDVVKAGAELGTPAVQNNGLYRFEVQVNKDVAGVTTHYCPSVLLGESFKATVLADLEKTQTAWENVKLQSTLYDTTKQNPSGCLKPTMSVAEAEGR